MADVAPVECKTPKYSWTQSVEEVNVTVPVPQGTRARDVIVDIKQSAITVGLKGSTPLLKGELFSKVKASAAIWTIVDNAIQIVLPKIKQHESWRAVVIGEFEVDELTNDEMRKKMMLEKFQNEHPGFDFSGASFSGNVPDDPENFGRFDN